MVGQDTVQLVQQVYDAFKRGDIQGVLNLVADDVDWSHPGPPDVIPFVGHYRGRDGVAQFFARLGGAEDVEHFEPQEFFAAGDRVVALGRYRARIKATGRTNDIELVHVYTVRGGKIVSLRQYNDTAAVAEAYRGTSAQSARTTS